LSIERIATRAICGIAAEPINPDEQDVCRWRMPQGWVMVFGALGEGFVRHCPRCSENDRYMACNELMHPDRIGRILDRLREHWQRHPERLLFEIMQSIVAEKTYALAGLIFDDEVERFLRTQRLWEDDPRPFNWKASRLGPRPIVDENIEHTLGPRRSA
jgi:hypothetical protein